MTNDFLTLSCFFWLTVNLELSTFFCFFDWKTLEFRCLQTPWKFEFLLCFLKAVRERCKLKPFSRTQQGTEKRDLRRKWKNYDYELKKLALNSLSIRKLYQIYLNCSSNECVFLWFDFNQFSQIHPIHADDAIRDGNWSLSQTFFTSLSTMIARDRFWVDEEKRRYSMFDDESLKLNLSIPLIRF